MEVQEFDIINPALSLSLPLSSDDMAFFGIAIFFSLSVCQNFISVGKLLHVWDMYALADWGKVEIPSKNNLTYASFDVLPFVFVESP